MSIFSLGVLMISASISERGSTSCQERYSSGKSTCSTWPRMPTDFTSLPFSSYE